MVANRQSQTVLITGASSGIGKVTCLYLAEKGYNVIGTSRASSRLGDLYSEADQRGVSVHGLELDINSDAEVRRVMPEVFNQFGDIHALVNNAGYSVWGPVESVSIDEMKTLFETNLFAAVRMTQSVLPGMIERGAGKIINISSILGRLATPFNGVYAASKFALEGLSESMRTEVSPLGVHVALVEPGLFETEFQRNQVRAARADDPKLAYAPYVQRYNARHQTYDRLASDPVKVSKVIHKIIRSRRPALRHPVGLEAHAGIIGSRLIPGRLFQWMLGRATMR
ncbi:MAG: SDR family oxidoreductase [SAR202 cluster bacterium]|jgi:short-subunit dehydrogenase|nr:SDR family oxidoreductase [SAR202 cluster bacterium]MDP6714405.1 SDR family oxidoreductase [SAR202 cluster bacterium]